MTCLVQPLLHTNLNNMGDFGATSKFRVSLAHSDGSSERVSVTIGLDGLKISDVNSGRTMRSYELGHISRWQSRGSSLVLYTKTPIDLEERSVTLQGDEHTIRSCLDTLTCSCMQLAELLQSKQSDNDQETANSLHALVAGGGKKKASPKLPDADSVEYWRSPDKAGWMQCQGETLKTWRKRWFVLKQGYLFRFMNSSVSESTKPRGVVDLSKVQDVKPASSITGRPNSIQLKTASGGGVSYICDTETEMVEWISAMDGAIQKIVKHLAGVEDEPAQRSTSSAAAKKSGGSSSTPSNEWMRQLEKNFSQLSGPSGRSGSSAQAGGGGGGSSGHYRSSNGHGSSDYPGGRSSGVGAGFGQYPGNAMVDVVGYDTIGGGGGSSAANGRGGGSSYKDYQQPGHTGSGVGGGGGYGGYSSSDRYGNGSASGAGGTSIGYGNIMGASAVSGLSSDTLLNYGSSATQAPGYSAGGGQYQPSPAATYAAAPGYGQQPAAVTASHGYGGSSSLIDAVPQSQPSYPYYQQGVAPAPQQQQSVWQVHHTPEGTPYYYNTSTGSTQWEAPPGF